MNKNFRWLLITPFLFLFCFSSTDAWSQTFNPCELYGSVYIEKQYPQDADFIVYMEDSEAFADLLIYKEENSLFADREGMWFFTENKDFSDFTILITKDKGLADFSIFYTDIPSFAGCN